MGVYGLLFALVAGRLADLQVWRFSYFNAVAASQRQRASELVPHRGTIYVAEGQNQELFPVASNTIATIAYAVPRDMPDPAAVADQLAPALYAFRQRTSQRAADIIAATGQHLAIPSPSITPSPSVVPNPEEEIRALREQLYQKFNQRTDPYEPLLKIYEVLDDELKNWLAEKKFDGIILEEREVRVYPEKTLAAHVLGYLGWQEERQVGRYGIEGFFDTQLAGDAGWLSSERDTEGQVIGVGARDFRPAQDGADVVLTIDRVVQSIIEAELKDGVERYSAQRGSMIVMNPKTGAILATATYPTFDPNQYQAIVDPRVQLNPIVSDQYEPGSTLKPAIMAAAMNEHTVKPETTFTDSGPVRIGKFTINTFDTKHHGLQTMTQILEKSNNIGMVWVAQQVGAPLMYDYLRRFGFGERTGVELEGETGGRLLPPNTWSQAQVATTGFGQGLAVNPLQVLNAINVIANKGQLMQPYIVARVRQSDGKEDVHQPTIVRQVISQDIAAQVAQMMVSVIENGVATLARVPGYHLAGKTGTAQVADENGKYSTDKKIISFVGFGPVEDPQFSVLIKLDNPSGLSFASGTAAPMFRHVAEKLLTYYQISPAD